METPASVTTREFIVQGDAVGSEPFAVHVKEDPGVHTLDRIAPDTVVLAMSNDGSARLRARFGPAIRIEPNADLTPPL